MNMSHLESQSKRQAQIKTTSGLLVREWMQEAVLATSELDTTIQRWVDFISRDPAQDGRNWFVYCSNNPLKYVDLSGLMQTVSDWLKDPLGNASELGGYGDPGSYWDDWDKEEVKLIVPSFVDKLYDSDASYSSSDMAAMAFGTKINDLSINFNIEFGAYI